MTIALGDIAARNWQPALGNQHDPRLGEIVEDLADIRQSIGIILTTQRRSDPLRPEFGIDVLAALDRPAHLAIPRLIRQARAALALWEPRAEILSLTGRIASAVDNARVILSIRWRPAGQAAVPGGDQLQEVSL